MSSLALSALLAAGAPAAAPLPPVVAIAQLTIRQRVILRVPTRPVPAQTPMRWKEGNGPRCIAADSVAAAALSGKDRIDLILRGGLRLRAEFSDNCPTLDYYRGFYLIPASDRRICADRDSVHARSGGECEIERFRTLTAEPVPPPKPKRRRMIDMIRGERR
ncbi:hypothetical protein ABC347_00740 [Sphingomonas sp. 1P06PA]|uniref:hypothetical protein n=1 Tax=Sphingomonas sp. 1P06PA TaxID=554121 RepID=UPI0039A5CB02